MENKKTCGLVYDETEIKTRRFRIGLQDLYVRFTTGTAHYGPVCYVELIRLDSSETTLRLSPEEWAILTGLEGRHRLLWPDWSEEDEMESPGGAG